MCVCEHCVVVEPSLILTPQNSAVTEDSEVTLDCTSNVSASFITWFNGLCPSYEGISTCMQNSIIYNGYNNLNNPPRFTVTAVKNTTHNIRDLNIQSTQHSDAGVYVCVENIPGEGVHQTSSAQLVIIIGWQQCCFLQRT